MKIAIRYYTGTCMLHVMHRWDKNPEEFRKNVEAKSDIKVVMLREGEEYQVT